MVTLKNAHFSLIWAFLFLVGAFVAKTWQVFIIKKHLWSVSVKGKYPYKEARLSDSNGDLSKQWVVEYYIWSEQQEKLIRKRVRLSDPTAADHYEQANSCLKPSTIDAP